MFLDKVSSKNKLYWQNWDEHINKEDKDIVYDMETFWLFNF